MRFNPRQLEAFLRLTEAQSFTHAATGMAISQPTLSRIIQKLEQEAGVRLLDRDTASVVLTPAGAAFHGIAQRLMQEFDGAAHEFAQILNGQRGRLTVAALPSIAAALLPRALVRMREQAPDTDVIILDSLAESVLAQVAAGRADVGITIRPPSTRALSYEPLLTDSFCLVGRPDCIDGKAIHMPWSTFERQPFIAMSQASSVRLMTDAAFLQAGIAVAPLYECSNLGTTGALVSAGLGITALPHLAVRLLADRDLLVVPLVEPVLNRSIGVVTRARRHEKAIVRTFLDAVAKEVRNAGLTIERAR